MEITIKKEEIALLTDVLKKKKGLQDELSRMDRYMKIYKKEFSQLDKVTHTTKDGNVVLISEMEESHLLNTIQLMVNKGYDVTHTRLAKYVEEVKKRGIVNKIMSMEVPEDDDEDDIEDLFNDDFNF